MKRIAHIKDGYIVNVSLGADDAELQPGQMLESDALAAGFTRYVAQPAPKRWPNAEAFVAEFTMAELSAISLSADPTIAALRFLLSTWSGEIHSDDPRVIEGLSALFVTNTMSSTRLSEIIAP